MGVLDGNGFIRHPLKTPRSGLLTVVEKSIGEDGVYQRRKKFRVRAPE